MSEDEVACSSTPTHDLGASTNPRHRTRLMAVRLGGLLTVTPRSMSGVRQLIGSSSLGVYRGAHRVWAKAFSLLVSGGFGSFGNSSVLEPPVRLDGERWIAV